MAVLFATTFDAATSGNITTATTGASSVISEGPSLQHSTTQKINVAAMSVTGTISSHLRWNLTATGTVFTRLYLRRETVLAELWTPALWLSSTTARVRLAFEAATGNLLVRDGTTVVATYPFTTAQWYRVDWSVETGVGQRVRLYTGATIHSANTADAVAGGALLAASSVSALDRFYLGQVVAVSSPVSAYVDEVVVDGAALPAPFVPPAAGRRLERKVSGVWAPHLVEKKVSGAWVPQIVERKDAGVWS
jgi:hypothetical protein